MDGRYLCTLWLRHEAPDGLRRIRVRAPTPLVVAVFTDRRLPLPIQHGVGAWGRPPPLTSDVFCFRNQLRRPVGGGGGVES